MANNKVKYNLTDATGEKESPEVIYRENLLLKREVKDLHYKLLNFERKIKETDDYIASKKDEIVKNAKKEFISEINNLKKELGKKDDEINELNNKIIDTKQSEEKYRNLFYQLDNQNYEEKKAIIEKAKNEKIEELKEQYAIEKQKLIDKWDKIREERNSFADRLNKIIPLSDQITKLAIKQKE